MVQDRLKKAQEIYEQEQDDYEEDYNRLDKELDAKTITSKEEWQQRLRQKGYDTIPKKLLDKWYDERVSKYIEENKPKAVISKKVKYTRKGRTFYRVEPKKWTKEQEEYILKHPKERPKELYKKGLFTGRTRKSITSKRYRLFRKKYETVEKGYGKRGWKVRKW